MSAIVTVLAVGGCRGIQPASSATSGGAVTPGFAGVVRGGQQPIAGGSIQLYAVGDAGDGSPATPLLATPVITNQAGAFDLTGLYQCPSPTTNVYLVDIGGNAGVAGGSNNQQIALMTAVGPCGGRAPPTSILVNEVTTVAAVYALLPYTQSVSAVGSSQNDSGLLSDAFSTAAELANWTTVTPPGSSAPNGQTVPVQKLNALANVVSSCVNSSGGRAGDSTPCGLLLTLGSVSGAVPTDTFVALTNIAENPTSNVVPIFNLDPAVQPFQPSLSAAPADWTIAITSSTPLPVISPAAGSYFTAPTITISDSNPAVAIYYTQDGRRPTAASTFYIGAFTVPGSSVVRAVAIAGGISSLLAAATYAVAAPTITISPTAVSLRPSQAQAFSATVLGSANTSVNWSVSPAIGTITSTGVYTAPSTVVAAQAIVVTATSMADPAVTASANALLMPAVSVTINPGSVLLTPSQQQTFTATVSNSSDDNVKWSVSPAIGSISALGVYTAPASITSGQMVTVTATSEADATASANASLSLGATPPSTLPPGSVFIPPPANLCGSSYDQFYQSEPGVYAFWALCEAGSNPTFYDYVGTYDWTRTSTPGVIPEWGQGKVVGGAAGPVADGETAATVSTAANFIESQDIVLNKNAGTIATWVNVGLQPSDVRVLSFSAVTGQSAVFISTHASGGMVCFNANYQSSTGFGQAISKCGNTANAWHRVVESWSSGTLSLAVDGKSAASGPVSGVLDDRPFFYMLFPGCCDTGVQITAAKSLIANQAWSAAQIAADFAPTLVTPPAGGIYVSTQQLGTIHSDVLGYGDIDSDLSTPALTSALTTGLAAAGVTSLRYAGGYAGIQADLANWEGGANCTSMKGVTTAAANAATNNTLSTYIPEVAQPLQLHLGYTVNYGTNPPACNAGGDPVVNGANLVNYANKTLHYDIKYWEIGNELYSTSSETDFHPLPGDGASYATYEVGFYNAMKAQDSSIQIGIPVAQGVYSWIAGWTLPAMAAASYDAAIFHSYPVLDPINDGSTLYQDRVAANISRTRGSLLTVQTELLNFAKPADAIWITEWNGDTGNGLWSRQSLGAVMPMFAAIQLAEYMQAGVRFANWFAQGATNVCSPYNYDSTGESTYSWWSCGSPFLAYTGSLPSTGEIPVGFQAGQITPAARAFQILSKSGFVQEGEHMLRTFPDTKNAPWLAGYAATHGSSYALILINRDRDSAHTVPVKLAGATSGTKITQSTYGRAQYDQTYNGDWAAAPTQMSLGPWSGAAQVTLPAWSTSVLILK